MAKNADGPISGRMVFTGGNPITMKKQGGMTMRDGDDTISDYINAANQQRASTADNVPKGMLPGRVERKPKRKRRSKP
jgi:hypothetical protein